MMENVLKLHRRKKQEIIFVKKANTKLNFTIQKKKNIKKKEKTLKNNNIATNFHLFLLLLYNVLHLRQMMPKGEMHRNITNKAINKEIYKISTKIQHEGSEDVITE